MVERRSDRVLLNIYNMRVCCFLVDMLYFNGKIIVINLFRDMESIMYVEFKIVNVWIKVI